MSRGTLNNGRWWIGFCNGGIKGETGQTTKQPFLSLLNLASSPFPDPESIAFLECYGRFWFPHKDHSDNNENEISQHYSSTQILFNFDVNAVLNLDRLIILYILLRKSSIFIYIFKQLYQFFRWMKKKKNLSNHCHHREKTKSHISNTL